MTDTRNQVYVSTTGLTLKSPLHGMLFGWHATQSFSQAASASGNLSTDARMVDGVHHALTVWETREAMLDYLRQGPHLHAMKAYRSLGHGKVHGYYALTPPTWSEALNVWARDAHDV